MAEPLHIGARISHYRKKNGNRPLAAVAGLCGVTERYFSMLENGKRNPSPKLLNTIASELGVSVAALLTDQPPEPPKVRLTTARFRHNTLDPTTCTTCGSTAGPMIRRTRTERASESHEPRVAVVEPRPDPPDRRVPAVDARDPVHVNRDPEPVRRRRRPAARVDGDRDGDTADPDAHCRRVPPLVRHRRRDRCADRRPAALRVHIRPGRRHDRG
ncbi:XRE family transcriptional regulator [Streptomyces sp. AJS327]|nr:XRE family transcriptional regulator [Streptomyces sp. AJS327]